MCCLHLCNWFLCDYYSLTEENSWVHYFSFWAFLLICITFHDTVRKHDMRAPNLKSLGNFMCVHVYVVCACMRSCSYKYGQIHMKYVCRRMCVCTCVEILMYRSSSTLFHFFYLRRVSYWNPFLTESLLIWLSQKISRLYLQNVLRLLAPMRPNTWRSGHWVWLLHG